MKCYLCNKNDVKNFAPDCEECREKERREREERFNRWERNWTFSYSSSSFAFLGLSNGASIDEIKRAYRAKAKACHPDRGGKHEDMVKLNKAYQEALKSVGGR